MGEALRILFVEDEEDDVELILRALRGSGFQVDYVRVETAEDMQSALRDRAWDIILCDYHMPRFDAIQALRVLKESGQDLPFILISGTVGEDVAVAAMKAGAHDYFVKTNLKRLPMAVQREVHEARIRAQQRQAEEAARISEARFRAAFNYAAVGLKITDADNCIIQVNPYFCQMMGYCAEDILGRSQYDFISPLDLPDITGQFDEAFSKTKPFFWNEYRCRHRSGEIIWVRESSSCVRDSEGRPLYVVSLIQDITKHRLAEEHLAIEARFNRTLINTVQAIILVLDHEGHVVKANDTFEKLTGFTFKEVKGHHFIDCVASHERDACQNDFSQILAGQKIVYSELTLKTKDKGRRLFAFHSTGLPNELGAVDYVVVTGFDITERRMQEAQLLQAQKLEAIGQLAAGVAHEINTPIQYVGDNTLFLKQVLISLVGMIEDIRKITLENRTPGRGDEALKRIKDKLNEEDLLYLRTEGPTAIEQTLEGVDRITTIVRSLKQFAHPDQEHKTWLDINQAIENTIILSHNEWKYVARMSTDLDPDLPRIFCKPGQINQVILNLIVNAAHAIAEVVKVRGGELGTITVATRKLDKDVEIRIGDNGCGITEKIRSKVFDPFFTTKEVGKGTGQGLAIAHTAIVDRHGGSITFETTEGQGTTFIIRIPVTPNE